MERPTRAIHLRQHLVWWSGLHEGDVFKANIIGSKFTAYINGTMVLQGMESTYTSGNPGIRFYLQGATGMKDDYGVTNFSATDAPIIN